MVVWNVAIYVVVLVYVLSTSNVIPCMWILLASSYIQSSLQLFDSTKIFLIYALFQNKLIWSAAHAFAVHASSYHMHRQNGVQQLANSALSAFPTKKTTEVKSQSHSRWSPKCTSQKNSWQLVAVSNATLITLWCYAGNSFISSLSTFSIHVPHFL